MADQFKFEKDLRCYVFGHGQDWEGLCVDLDIGVQGSSPDEVERHLRDAILSYARSAMDEGPADFERLMNRRSPFTVRARHAAGAWLQEHVPNLVNVPAKLFSRDHDRRQRFMARVPCRV
jgi:hypothetical protein